MHTRDTRTEHVAVIHTVGGRDLGLIVPLSNLPELKARLHLDFVYSETLGQSVYEHYDCWGVRVHCWA